MPPLELFDISGGALLVAGVVGAHYAYLLFREFFWMDGLDNAEWPEILWMSIGVVILMIIGWLWAVPVSKFVWKWSVVYWEFLP